MQPGEGQLDVGLAAGQIQVEGRAGSPGHDIAGVDVGIGVDAERDQAGILDELRPVIEIAIVGVEDGDLRPRFSAQDLALGARDAVQRPEAFEMRGPRVGNDDDIRPGQRRQVSNFARVVCAHLQDRKSVLVLDAGQHQRHADVVVQVAVRRQRRRSRGQACGRQLLERRFAVAARHADHDRRQLLPPCGTEFAQRTPGIPHRDLRYVGVDEPRHDRACRAFVTGLAEVVAAVEVRSLQGDEKLTLLQRARIDAHAVECMVGAVQFALHGISGGGQCRHHSPSSARPLRAARLAAATP